jgi:ATP-dependent RNA helicase DDX54/DBP10
VLLSAADDHRWLSSQRVEYVVCDEADRLFEMGFAAQLDAILQSVPPTRQTLLFSATMPALLADFTRANLHDPQLIRLDLDTKVSDTLEIHFLRVRPQEKLGALLVLLGQVTA